MWHSDDQFWKTYAPMMFTEKRWADAPAEVDSILKLLSPAAQGSILDLCCGPGRRREFVVSHRLYSARELSDLPRDRGFKKVKAYGDLAGAEYDHSAKRLVIVAQKA